ncbi:pseudouridine synthase [Paracoccus albus]|uniref:pseudouridine synthase n=1 Tax=Paracoccus albus TaxID=3017784 RepID=UPI0022F09CD4|nr:pseudouridine synthase [Paracoccus albus]WBU60786.1 pseudouridine synthase [Paracoccus albus]
MTDPKNPEKPADADRIAKVMARAGVASRREAERMILEGRVAVNGKKIDSPALDVLPSDKVTVDGKKLDEPQETRLWLYYKPVGLVTSENDEKGRQTVFDALPRDLPRVMSVGRLDLNSEGLLLLTNDGELKRRLELPETGWLRRYRVRVNGQPNDLTFAPLRRGVEIDGEEFAPMEIKLDSQQGANAWLTVGIREGKNREIRRAMAHVGLQVNRLIRIGYGPFKLTGMEENEVREIKRRVLRDQLGGLLTGEPEEKERPFRARGADEERCGPRRDGARDDLGRDVAPRKFGARSDGNSPRSRVGAEGRFRKERDREDGPKKFGAVRQDGSGRPRRDDGERGLYERGDRDGQGRGKPKFNKNAASDGAGKRSFGRDPDGERKPRGGRDRDARGSDEGRRGKPFGRSADRPHRDRDETRGFGGGDGGKPRPRSGFKPRGEGPKRDGGPKPRGRDGGGRPGGGKPGGRGGPARSGRKGGPRRPKG